MSNNNTIQQIDAIELVIPTKKQKTPQRNGPRGQFTKTKFNK